MAAKRGAGKLMATAAALTLPLWLGCAPGPDPSAGRTFPPDATTVERTAPAEAPLVPAPEPQAPPPALAAPTDTDLAETDPAGVEPATPSTAPSGLAAGPSEPGRGIAAAPGAGAGPHTDPAVEARPSPAMSPAPTPGETPDGRSTSTQTVTAYYVLLDDGGASGVRFGCNDSLAGIRRSMEGPAAPLEAAIRALLDGSTAPGLYNALSASTLTFLSGSFDGTTVTVYLSGSVRPGGACDIPRVEAQLTQTAVVSVGAIRAEVYINGTPLAEALRLA